MCINCWKENGSHSIINERTIEAARLINELYDTEDGGAGGYGHCVFDDWNIDNNSQEDIAAAKHYKYAISICEETRLASIAALEFFDKLSFEERCSALALADGFIKPQNTNP